MIRPQPKPVREIDDEYVAWIKSRPCQMRLGYFADECMGPIDPHHVVPVSKGGSDRTCVPLCRFHHDKANRRHEFEAHYGIDLSAVVTVLNRWYDRAHPAKPKKERKKSPGLKEIVVQCAACGNVEHVPAGKLSRFGAGLRYRCLRTNELQVVRVA